MTWAGNGETAMKTAQNGMTLVEIAIVLAIVGAVAVTAFPNILLWRASLELRSAASEISGVLMQARTKAIVDRTNYTVAFDGAADTYTTTKWLAGAATAAGGTVTGRVGPAWRSIDIFDDDTDPACPPFSAGDVVFRPNSSADASGFEAVYLRDAAVSRRYRVKVLGVTGRIAVERWVGDAWQSEQ